MAFVSLDVNQQSAETVLDNYSRVVKSVDNLEALLPVVRRLMGANFFILTLDGWGAVPDASKNDTAAAYKGNGVTSAFNHLALQLFIANLRPNLREELLKNILDTLFDAFAMAQDIEN
jgi:hypothetical protein